MSLRMHLLSWLSRIKVKLFYSYVQKKRDFRPFTTLGRRENSILSFFSPRTLRSNTVIWKFGCFFPKNSQNYPPQSTILWILKLYFFSLNLLRPFKWCVKKTAKFSIIKCNYNCHNNGILSIESSSNIFLWLEVMLLMTK